MAHIGWNAITLVQGKRFTIRFPGAKVLGIRHWLAMQAVGLAIMIAGRVDVAMDDEVDRAT